MGQTLRAMDNAGTVKISVISAPDIPERARQIHGLRPVGTAALGRALCGASLLGRDAQGGRGYADPAPGGRRPAGHGAGGVRQRRERAGVCAEPGDGPAAPAKRRKAGCGPGRGPGRADYRQPGPWGCGNPTWARPGWSAARLPKTWRPTLRKVTSLDPPAGLGCW